MVAAVRAGASLRHVADRFGVALATVQRWVARAGQQRLDRVDWADRPCFDGVEGLVIQGGIPVEVLNGISLHGGLVVSWPHTVITAQVTVESLIEHWRAVGLPGYAQFDNDPIFEGAQIHPDTIGRV